MLTCGAKNASVEINLNGLIFLSRSALGRAHVAISTEQYNVLVILIVTNGPSPLYGGRATGENAAAFSSGELENGLR